MTESLANCQFCDFDLTTAGSLLEGSWDLVSRVISTSTRVISRYNYSYLIYNPVY